MKVNFNYLLIFILVITLESNKLFCFENYSWKKTGFKQKIEQFTFSSSGKLIASKSWDRRLRVFDIFEHREICKITDSDFKEIADFSFSNNDSLLLVVYIDRQNKLSLLIYDLVKNNKKLIQVIDSNAKSYTKISISRSSNYLTGYFGKKLIIWNVREKNLVYGYENDTSYTGYSLVITNDEKHIVVMQDKKNIILDLSNGAYVREIPAYNDIYSKCVVSPNSKYIINYSNFGVIDLYDFEKGLFIFSFDPRRSIDQLEFSKDGKNIYFINKNTIYIYDLLEQKQIDSISNYESRMTGFNIYEDNGYKMIAIAGSSLKVFDLSVKIFLATFYDFSSEYYIDFNNKNELLTIHNDIVNFWNTPDGSFIKSKYLDIYISFFHSTNNMIIGRKDTNKIFFIDLETLNYVDSLILNYEISSISLPSQNMNYIMVRSRRGKTEVIEIKTKEVKFSTDYDVYLSPLGNYIYGLTEESLFYIKEISKDRIVRIDTNFSNFGFISSNEKYYFITPRGSFALKQYELTTGRLIRVINPPSQSITNFYVTKDNRMLISSSYDGYIYISDISFDTILMTLGGYNENIDQFKLSYDHNYITAVYSDNSMTTWVLPEGFISNVSNQKLEWDKHLTIFPNPAEEYIEISGLNKGLQPLVHGSDIKIFNLLGECVIISTIPYTQTPDPSSLRIDVSGLPAGVYFVRVGDWVWRFMKI